MRWRLWGPVLGYVALIFALTSLPRKPDVAEVMGFSLLREDLYEHILAFVVLSVLLVRAWRGQRPDWSLWRAAGWAFALAAAYGVLDELHQAPIPGRTCSPWDLLANGVGAGVGIAVAVVWHARRGRVVDDVGARRTSRRAGSTGGLRVANVPEVNEETFESVVLKSEKPVLVDFWAPWCGPCRMVGPVVEALADRYDGKIGVAKLNVDDAPALATQFGIRSIPALMIFKDGEVAAQTIGAQPEDALATMIDEVLAG